VGIDLVRGKVAAMVAIISLSGLAYGMQLPVLPLYLSSLHIAPPVIGLILGTFGFALVIFEFAWGWWSDHVGVGLPLIITRTGIAVVMLGYGLVQATPWFFVLQFALGAFFCASGPLPWTYFGHVIPRHRRGEAIGLAQTSVVLGVGIGALAGGAAADLLTYRPVFFIAAGFAVASAAVAFATFRDVGPVADSEAVPAVAVRSAGRRLPPYLWPLLVLASISILTQFGLSGERGFLPLLANSRGIRATEVGILLTVVSTGSALLMVPVGRLSDRAGRKPVLLMGIVAGTLGLAGYSVASSFSVLLALAALRAFSGAATQPVLITVLSEVTPSRMRGQAMGLFGSIEDIGIAVGPAVSGFIWGASTIGSAFLAMAGASILGLAIALGFVRERSWAAAAAKDSASTPEYATTTD
jgi:MFS family permease